MYIIGFGESIIKITGKKMKLIAIGNKNILDLNGSYENMDIRSLSMNPSAFISIYFNSF